MKDAASAQRLKLRDDFFRGAVDYQQLLQPFASIPGVLYFVKDAQSRLMAISPDSVARMGFAREDEIIGRTVHEYLPADLADKYVAGDQWVIKNGKPLLNVLEIFFNAQGLRDWIITNKFPLKDSSGKVIGLIGIIQGFEARRKQLAHLGPVGKAVDFIRSNLGESISLSGIAGHAGLSERQLQRLFKSVFGMTIQDFIIQSRIQGAIRDLTHSGRALSEIAFKFGFGDQSAFSNRFRKITGLTPRAYRRRYAGHSPTQT